MSADMEEERETITAETTAEAAAGSEGKPSPVVAPAATETRVETVRTTKAPRRGNRTALVAVVALAAVAALVLIWWLTRAGSGGAGRVVPAPRAVAVPETAGGAPAAATTGEPTVTLQPDAAARFGIRVEPVGEALAAGEGGAAQAAAGVVQANAYRTTPVVSLVGGVVRRIDAELGRQVRRGQTLAVVQSDALAEAQSKYLATTAELEEHHKHHERTVRLVEIGAASREELEMATTRLKTAEAEIASVRQRLLLLGLTPQRVAALRSPSQISSEVALVAPSAGTVIERAANPGEVVEANKMLLRVADLSTVWVIGQVYEKDLSRVRVGSGASVTSDAYAGRVFRGRVSYVDPQLDPSTRTAQVRVELANPGGALKIGMFVNVSFGALGGAEATAPTVPASAVQNLNGRQVVFVATQDPGVFIMRGVRVGPETNGRRPVLEGLFVGERVVTEGSFMLRAEWLKLNPGAAGQHQH